MIRKCTNRLFQAIMALLFVCAVNAHADDNNKGSGAKWGYIGNLGPVKWGQLDPSFAICALGKSQSPINIGKKFTTAANALEIKYQSAPMVIVNDGETKLLIGHSQTIINNGHSIQLNFPQKGPKETITYKDKDYHLVQFHIHTPSETALNNQIFPMEIHFVHQSDDGQVAVIAVLVKAGPANQELQNIINHFPTDHGIEHTISSEKINPIGLIPAKHDYYSFAGSLTTPPCTEGLQWIVMPNFITASAAQIVLFKKAVDGENARPIQPTYKRHIYFSAA